MTTAELRLAAPALMRRQRLRQRTREIQQLAFILAHAPLGVAIRSTPLLATVHALAVLAVGLHWCTSRRTAHKTVLAAAYLVGAEVLWRMSGGAVVYEFGKYGCVLLLAAAATRLPGWRRPAELSALYFILLLPSIMLTLQLYGVGNEARRQLSFNLSGPFALAVAAFVLSGCSSTSLDLRAMLVALVAPLVGVGAAVGRYTLLSDRIVFGTSSNFATSGGFGPNQVSAVLGLGAVVCLFLALSTAHALWRWAYLALCLVMISQAVLTFSRGGVINALICAALLGVHFLRQPRARATLIIVLLLFGALGGQLILPALDSFTGGLLSQRYAEIDPSLRREIAAHELEIFRQHPLLGVGPGAAKEHRRSYFQNSIAAHTEYTRLLAEHGAFGLGALLILIVLVTTAYLRAPTLMTKAWVATLAGWSMLEMSHAAMRIGAIPFLFGLALVRWNRPPGRPAPARTANRVRPVTSAHGRG